MLNTGDMFGSFIINQLLGQGGMGTVYLVHTADDNQLLALKLLNQDLVESPEYRERLRREADINASLDSPYVVRVQSSGEIENQPYIAMEYVDGKDLREKASVLSFEDKALIAGRIGEGIQAAHEKDLIHRDLKPENVLVTEDNTPKILDFGLAREVDPDEVDDDGNIEGTLFYFAPEQLCGETLTHKCDMFSFGSMLYELFAGQRPFVGEYTASIIYDILHEEPIPPCEVNTELPAWINPLIAQLMAKHPEDRFSSMEQVIKFIEQGLATGATEISYDRPKQSVTVIDLKNMSGDEGWNYFCEGFTDDVIRELSRRTDLVISTEPSALNRRNIKETFEKCRSDYVIVGSLMKWHDKIKLSLTVHGAEGEEIVFSESYTDHSDNIFELLAKVAIEASAKLAGVTDSTHVEVDEEFRPDVTAYDFYLRGKAYYQTNKPEDLVFAEEMFTHALKIDPQFALAHTGMSDVYAFQYMAFYDRTPERIAAAREEAEKALVIDPLLPDAHRSVARYYMFTGDTEQAEVSLLKAVELNPKYALGFRTLGWLQRATGDYQSAVRWARKALEFTPTDLETLLLLALLSLEQRQFSAARSILYRAIDLAPDYGRAYYYLGVVYLKLGVANLALQNFSQACKYKGDPNCLIECGAIHLVRGDYEMARVSFQNSIDAEYFPFVAHYFLGLTARMSGDESLATEQFQKAIDLMGTMDLSLAENQAVMVYHAMANAALGHHDEARAVLQAVEKTEAVPADTIRDIARCYCIMGDEENGLRILKRAFSDNCGPTVKEARLDPHFINLTLID